MKLFRSDEGFDYTGWPPRIQYFLKLYQFYTMRHEVNKRGEISLHPSREEMGIIANLLSARHFALRNEQQSRHSLEQVTSIMSALHEAILESNNVICANIDKKRPIENSQPSDTFFSRIYNFINPELTILEFEGANTYCNQLFQLTSMDFRVDNPKIPYNIRGYVQYRGDWIPSTWNSHGKCSCPKLGKDQSQYNLKRKRKRTYLIR